MAVHVISARRALVLLYREIAEVIHVDDGVYSNYDFEAWREISEFLATDGGDENDDWICGVGFSLQVPRVIRLNHYDKVPRQSLRFNRRNIFARDENTCQYCKRHFPQSQLSLDHVMPKSRDGKTTWENVVCSCVKCNTRKGDRTPEEANMHLARKPVKPKQSPVMKLKLDNPKYAAWRNFVQVAEKPVDVA